MTGAYVSRRRAEEFDALLSAPAREHDSAASYVDLLELVGELRAMPAVTARPDFVSALRSQLVVEAARQARPVVDDALRLRLTPRQRQGARERRAATVLGGFAIVAASGSMAMASQSALPGDVLYPVKRAIENADTNLQSDDAAKAQTLIAHAEQRLLEAERLTAEGADGATVAQTLQDFTDQSSQATELALDDYATTGDQAAIGELRTFANSSMGHLSELGDVVPTDARAALISAAQSVLHADTAAFQACPTCGDGAVTELPKFATEPVALFDATLLTYETTASSVPGLSPDFLAQVEGIAEETPTKKADRPGKNADDTGTSTTTTDDTGTSTNADAGGTDDATNPLQNLGEQIKNEVERDHSDDLDPVIDAVTGVVPAVDGLVDGILGN